MSIWQLFLYCVFEMETSCISIKEWETLRIFVENNKESLIKRQNVAPDAPKCLIPRTSNDFFEREINFNYFHLRVKNKAIVKYILQLESHIIVTPHTYKATIWDIRFFLYRKSFQNV